ncbi:MAG: prolipoprotein diacylglyceryl transferase [Devosia nanyangense]|uniref:Prolipoprotein diacylglyceryl transferase n=1 Tax=Devosia nanyangense TaxID=1228055 RepID=A0A933L4A6_9HYPH|nr:prolipoprotein diacylglyceryl transferase [Devosia nanyangense]
MAVFWLTTRRLVPAELLPANRVPYPGAYAIAAGAGALCGAMLFGTANALLSGERAIGFSMVGGIAGAIASIELFKHMAGVTGSTGIAFAAPFCATVAVGRWGCFFAGLADFTYGTPTDLPWGVDFGDGISRHPVQLYEAFSMTAMLVVLVERLIARDRFWLANGFYLAVGWYGLQRFVWEFFKPYATVIGPFNLFHIVCLGLLLYAGCMIGRTTVR